MVKRLDRAELAETSELLALIHQELMDSTYFSDEQDPLEPNIQAPKER